MTAEHFAETASRSKGLRFSVRTMFLFVAFVGAILGLLGREALQARREQAAYHQLCQRGATGDDWPGWKELFLGRRYAPIVEITLPPDLSVDEAMPFLVCLDNLESLALCGRTISVQDLDALSELDWIDSLRLSSTNVTNDSVSQIAKFRHLKWLYLDGTALTGEGVKQLQVALPNCKIER